MKDLLTPEDILKAHRGELEHLWVKITCTIVKVSEASTGEHFIVESTEEATDQAEEDAVFGCYFCDVPLTEGYNTPCIRSTST